LFHQPNLISIEIYKVGKHAISYHVSNSIGRIHNYL